MNLSATCLFWLLALSIGFGQSKVKYDLDHSCSYYGEKLTDEVYSFASSAEAKDIVERIVNIVGLEQNFTIEAANVPNAMAVIEDEERVILYSQNFISKIRNATGTDWSGISILAHEIGHHLNGHTLIPGGSRPNLELQADKFSGFVCAKLGSTLSEAQAAMSALASSSGSATHPPKSARLEAIAIGWNQGNSGSKPPASQPDRPSTKQQPPPVENRAVKTTTNVQIIYLGDQYGCNLPITITIGNRTFQPSGQMFTATAIPLGQQTYRINGQVNCPMFGGCAAMGEGTIYIREGSTFSIAWQNVAFGQCRMWLNAQ